MAAQPLDTVPGLNPSSTSQRKRKFYAGSKCHRSALTISSLDTATLSGTLTVTTLRARSQHVLVPVSNSSCLVPRVSDPLGIQSPLSALVSAAMSIPFCGNSQAAIWSGGTCVGPMQLCNLGFRPHGQSSVAAESPGSNTSEHEAAFESETHESLLQPGHFQLLC